MATNQLPQPTVISNTRSFRVVVPTADGLQVAGEFSTLLDASLFHQALIVERGLKCEVEWFRNGMWWSSWD